MKLEANLSEQYSIWNGHAYVNLQLDRNNTFKTFQLTLDPHRRVREDDFNGILHAKIGEFLNVLRVKNEKKNLQNHKIFGWNLVWLF